MNTFIKQKLNFSLLNFISLLILANVFTVNAAFAQAVTSCSSSLSAENLEIMPFYYPPNPAFKHRVSVEVTNTSNSTVKAQILTYSVFKGYVVATSFDDTSGIATLAPGQSTTLTALTKDCLTLVKLNVTSSARIVSGNSTSTSTSSCSSSFFVNSNFCASCRTRSCNIRR